MKRCMITVLSIALLLCACGAKETTWQEQYDLGVKYLSEGNYQEAIIAFTAAIEIDPKLALAYIGRGDAYIGSCETAENLSAAQADYEQAIELNETTAEAYLGLANVYICREEYMKAMEILEIAFEKTLDNRLPEKMAEIENLKNISDKSEMGNAMEVETLQPGLLIQKNYYEGDKLQTYTFYTYDEQGTCIEIITRFAEDDSIAEHELFDEHGNTTMYVSYASDEPYEQENIYDEEGRLIKSIEKKNGVLSDKETLYFYDENGLLIRQISDAKTIVYEYNSAGRMVFTEARWGSGLPSDFANKIFSQSYHEYDEWGNEISVVYPARSGDNFWGHHERELRHENKMEYDAYGRPMKSVHYLNGEKREEWYEYIYSD